MATRRCFGEFVKAARSLFCQPTSVTERHVKRVGRLAVGCLPRVNIEPERGSYVRMPEPLLENLDARPELDLIARVEMAQSVERQLRQIRRLPDWVVHVAGEVRLAEPSPVRAGEHWLVRCVEPSSKPLFLVLPQRVHCEGREFDHPAALLRLRFLESMLAVEFLQRVPDVQLLAAKVYVSPTQSERIPLPQPSRHHDHDSAFRRRPSATTISEAANGPITSYLRSPSTLRQ